MNTVPECFGSKYYRGFLSSQGMYFYDTMETQLSRGDYSGKSSFTIRNPASAASDCFAAYKALRDDHPGYFFLGFQSEFISRGLSATLTYPILYSSENIERIRLQLRKTIYRMVRGTASLPLFEREKVVYERIAKRIRYSDNNDVRDHNVVGPILMSSGVCEGHNSLLMLCFRRLGIPCIKVYGKTKTDSWHCWTIAWINGIPVHCDVTWDGEESGFVSFNYLNLSDSQISADHFDFKSPRIPECQSDSWNYYQLNGLGVNSYSELKLKIRTASSNTDSPMLIHFNYNPPSDDYIREVERALSDECIYGKHGVYCHQSMRNVAVRRL